MLTRSSWIKIAAIAVLGLCVCTGIGSCSLGCTPLVRGCAGVPWAGKWAAADYPNAGNGSVQVSQVRNIDLAWFEGRAEFHIVDDGEPAIAQESQADGHHVDDHGDASEHLAEVDASGEIRFEESASFGDIADGWKLRWMLDGETLRIAYCEPSNAIRGCTSISQPSKTLVITMPKSACEHLGTVSISAFSGDYNLDGLSCDTLEFDLASGRVDGNGTAFSHVDVEVASGQFNLEAQIADKLELEMASGNANITCAEGTPHTMDVSLASGNATLTMPADSGITANVNKLSGLFNFDMPDSHTYDDSFICGDGSAHLNVDMSSGNVTVRS